MDYPFLYVRFDMDNHKWNEIDTLFILATKDENNWTNISA